MPSVTFAPVCIASNRRKDGTIPVKIRVTFKGVSRRLPTNLVARPGDLTRSLHLKNPTLQNKAQALAARMQDTLADVSPFALDGWDVDRVVAHIRDAMDGEDFRLDLFQYADGFLAGKTPSTRRAYDSALNSLARYLGRRELDINAVTKRLVLDWMAWTDAQPKAGTGKPHGAGTASRNAVRVGHIFKAAKMRYNDDDRTLIPRSPFDGLPLVQTHSDGARALSGEEMQMVLDAEATGTERVALDAFILSFATMGANMADLWDADAVAGSWSYNRRKTQGKRADRAAMRVTIPPEVSGVLARLTGRGPWWLNKLHAFASDKDGCTHKVNRALRSWAERAGLEDVAHIKFYSARKSWATIARRIGVEKALVDECLAHKGDFPLTDIYAARDYGQMDAANRRVLDTLRWP